MRRSRGFSLLELMLAMALAAVIATAAVRMLIGHHRAYRDLSDRVVVNAALRMGAAFLSAEFREISSRDPAGPDIIAATAATVTYRAMRTFGLVCRGPEAGSDRVALAGALEGLRALDAARDSLLLLVGPGVPGELWSWVRTDLAAAPTAATCPDGTPGREIRLSGLAPALLGSVAPGMPVRGFEVTQLRLYADRDGVRWVGLRTRRKDGSWTVTQPVLGPLGVDGLSLVYFDQRGAVTDDPARIAGIGIALTGPEPVRGPPAGLETRVALRN